MKKNDLHTPPDFLVIGHICHDLVPDGFVPGGAAAYAGLLGARLGYATAVLTSWGRDFRFATQFEELAVELVPSACTTVFENKYDEAGQRLQYLHQRAADLRPEHLPQAWRRAKTVLLGPICDEVGPGFFDCFEQSVVCACPQGWMRQWDETRRVMPKSIEDWRLLAKADIISMSEADVVNDWDLIERIATMAKVLVVTQGQQGAVVFEAGRKHHFPAYPTLECDPTGAGDVFAAAFSLHYSEHRNLGPAAAFAHAAASLNVEGHGMAAVPLRSRVEERLQAYRS